MKRLRARMTYANVVATVALFMVLTGASAVAATQIGTAGLKNNAVTSAKVKNGSLLRVDFRPGQLPRGPQGPPGLPGAPGANGLNGANGTAKAYAMFDATAQQVVPARTFNMTIVRANQGIYCIDVPGISPTSATILATPAFPTVGIPLIFVQARTNGTCLPQQFEISTLDGSTNLFSNGISFAVAVV